MLAGVSVDYYIRLERGNLNGVSERVLDALARAFQLDEAERAHLFDLARATPRTRRRPTRHRVRPGVQRILDALVGAPAFVFNGRLDILAANQLGHALYSETYTDRVRPANYARFLFLNPRATTFCADWDRAADDVVGLLRVAVGRDPHDRSLSDVVGELSIRGNDFRVRWAADNVRFRRAGVEHLHHPYVGDLTLSWELLDLADPGLTLVVYSAEPGTASHDSLNMLASWAATRKG